MVDKGRQTRSIAPQKNRNIGKVILLLFSAIVFMIVVVVFLETVTDGYRIHPVSGTSMIPTLTEKDMVLIEEGSDPQRYELVAFSVEGESGKFVKRVIGLPGDAILVHNERIVINLDETSDFKTTNSFQISSELSSEYQNLGKIPDDEFFVTGDNLDVSQDSRNFGFVKKQKIEGVVKMKLPTIFNSLQENK